MSNAKKRTVAEVGGLGSVRAVLIDRSSLQFNDFKEARERVRRWLKDHPTSAAAVMALEALKLAQLRTENAKAVIAAVRQTTLTRRVERVAMVIPPLDERSQIIMPTDPASIAHREAGLVVVAQKAARESVQEGNAGLFIVRNKIDPLTGRVADAEQYARDSEVLRGVGIRNVRFAPEAVRESIFEAERSIQHHMLVDSDYDVALATPEVADKLANRLKARENQMLEELDDARPIGHAIEVMRDAVDLIAGRQGWLAKIRNLVTGTVEEVNYGGVGVKFRKPDEE